MRYDYAGTMVFLKHKYFFKSISLETRYKSPSLHSHFHGMRSVITLMPNGSFVFQANSLIAQMIAN
jgi:hypothetical protein